jgi:hypothetical protein
MSKETEGSTFARYFSGNALAGDYQSTDDESGEATELDTSEEETEEETETEAEETEEEGEEGTEDSSTEEPDYKAMYEDAEKKRRQTQSNLDQTNNEVRQLRQEFSDFKEDSETHDPFENLDDTEVLDVATAKKIVASMQPKKKSPKQSKPDPNFNNWMATQPGIEDINKYYKANEAEVNSKLQTVPTNEYGQFLMISSLQKDDHIKQQANEIKKLQTKVKKLSKKKKVPKMGPSGNPGKGRTPVSNEIANRMSRYFLRGKELRGEL